MAEKQYKLSAPTGSMVTPKEIMNAKELREFALQLVMDSSDSNPWVEKIKKDEIESVIGWMGEVGYTIEEVK